MQTPGNSIFMAQDLADLLHHCEEFGEDPLFVYREGSLTFKEYCQQVRRILVGLITYLNNTRPPASSDVRRTFLPEPQGRICILNIRDQILLAEAWTATVLSGNTACLLPDGHKIPDQLAGAYIIKDEDVQSILQKIPAYPETSNASLPVQDPEAVCMIAFSSGTTSEAKGVMLTQKNLLLDTEYSIQYYRYYRGMRLVHILPFWHLFGLAADLLAPLHCGSSLYIPSEFEQIEALSSFRPHTINVSPAFADVLVRLLRHSKEGKKVTGGCLERLICGGAPYAPETEKALLDLGILPCTGYGLTECSPCISITNGDNVHLGTAGVPLQCVRIRISHAGEILVSGGTIMAGYYSDPEGTRQRIRDGWFHTGDLGYLDEAGNLVITGRLSSMIVLPSGKKCVPESVEAILCQLPGISECCLSRQKKQLVLRVVSSLPAEEIRKLTDPVMVKQDLIPYTLTVQTRALARNKMGKLIR